MEPIKFNDYTTIAGRGNPGFRPLPVYRARSPLGEVVSCWKMNFLERLVTLFTGRVYVTLLTFNTPLQAQHVAVFSPVNEIKVRNVRCPNEDKK